MTFETPCIVMSFSQILKFQFLHLCTLKNVSIRFLFLNDLFEKLASTYNFNGLFSPHFCSCVLRAACQRRHHV